MSLVTAAARTIRAYAASAAGKSLELITYEAKPLREDEVEVKVLTSGLCYSDIDALDGKYGPINQFPLVAGHEGVGRVTAMGSYVKHLKLDQLVGLGCYRSTCNTCMDCSSGKNNLCSTRALMFAGGQNGSFGEYVRLDSKFAIPIPDGIEPEYASPLLCAGVTTFAPFRNHNIKSGDKVGIIGIGGLGHLAVQFASKMGCEVYAITGTPDKSDFVRQLGAHHVINNKDPESMKQIFGKLNYIFVTNSGSVDYSPLVMSLTNNGKIIMLGVSREPINVSAVLLLLGQKSIVGSVAGSSGIALDMLDFVRLHKIKPMIQKYDFKDVNQAIQDVRDGKVRFRAVLVHNHEA